MLTTKVLPTEEQQAVIALREEIDGYFIILRRLNALSPREVFQHLSAISARLSEIRGQLVRSDSRRFTAFRSREIDPLIEEVDRQFKIHSRVQSCLQMEWDLSAKDAL